MKISTAGRHGTSHHKTGQPAEAIHIRLEEDPNHGLTITGTHQAVLPFSETLHLDARGGDGAAGDIGAKGKTGERGDNGKPATEYRCGTNGGPGEDGGHGGRGSDGGDAGDGGHIRVSVKRGDLALLAAIGETRVAAGVPGAAGRHGEGGDGGRGGRGGSSFSWTTSHTTWEDVTHMDAHGHMHHHTEPRTHFDSHYNPGGSEGRSGNRGGQFTYPLHSGKRGSAGSVVWEVSDGHSVHGYADRYQMDFQHIRFAVDGPLGFCEPGAIFDAHYQIHNNAQSMPTPHEKVSLTLYGNPSLEVLSDGFIPGSIPAGQVFTNVEPLRFRVRAPESHPERYPYQETLTVHAAAWNGRLNRPYTSTQTSLSVRYPVELQGQPTHYTIASGDNLVLQASLKNLASQILGGNAGREIVVEIAAVDDELDKPVVHHIETIEPDAVNVTERVFAFPPQTLAGANQQFQARLFLQPVDRGKQLTLIQQQTITVQLTLRYQNSGSGFLLVSNNETSPALFNHWYHLLSQFAGTLPVSVWNTSYYRSFDLYEQPCNLLANTGNGTIVVLDNAFTLETRRTKNHRFITPEHVEDANRNHDTSLLIVGENEGLPVSYTPTSNVTFEESGQEHESVDDLLETMLRDEHSLEHNYRLYMPLQNNYYLFRTDRDNNADVIRLRQLLAEVFPGRRYHVGLRRDMEMERAVLTIHRLANPYQNHGAKPINEGTSGLELIQNMPFSQKLRLFSQIGSTYHRELARALTRDLLEEQGLLAGTRNYGSLGQRIMRRYQHDFREEMERLRQLVGHLYEEGVNGRPDMATAWAPMVIRMIAEVQFHAEQHSTFWTRFAHWFVPQAVEQIKETTRDLCQQVVRGHAPTMKPGMDLVPAMRDMNEDLAVELRRLAFEKRLDAFIEANRPRQSRSFFAARTITRAAWEAAGELRQLTTNACISVTDRSRRLFQAEDLKPWFDEFQLLYPASPQFEMEMPSAPELN